MTGAAIEQEKIRQSRKVNAGAYVNYQRPPVAIRMPPEPSSRLQSIPDKNLFSRRKEDRIFRLMGTGKTEGEAAPSSMSRRRLIEAALTHIRR